jgi:hypothetical protein
MYKYLQAVYMPHPPSIVMLQPPLSQLYPPLLQTPHLPLNMLHPPLLQLYPPLPQLPLRHLPLKLLPSPTSRLLGLQMLSQS